MTWNTREDLIVSQLENSHGKMVIMKWMVRTILLIPKFSGKLSKIFEHAMSSIKKHT